MELEGAAVVADDAHTGLEGVDDSEADDTIVEGARAKISEEDPDEIEDIAVVRFNGHEDSVYSAAFHPTLPVIASGDGDDTLLVWDAARGEIVQRDSKSTHKDTVMFSQFSPDGKYLATCSMDSTIQVFKVHQGPEAPAPAAGGSSGAAAGSSAPSASASTSKPSSAPAAEGGGQVRLTKGSALVGPGGDFNFAAWHPSSPALLVGSEDCMGWVFDARNGKLLASLAGHDAGVLCGCFSPKGNTVLTGSVDGTVRSWHAVTGECKQVIQGRGWFSEGEPVLTLACHPSQPLVLAGAADGTARLANYKTGKVIATYSHTKRIGSTAVGGSGADAGGVRALADDGDPAAAGAGSGAGAGAAGKGKGGEAEVGGVKTSDLHDGAAEDVAVTVEGVGFCTCGLNWAATGATDGSLCIWDLGSNSMRRSFVQEGSITRIQWHPELACVITAAADGTLRVFDARAGKELSRVAAHSGMVLDMQMWRAPAAVAATAGEGGKEAKAGGADADPGKGAASGAGAGAAAGGEEQADDVVVTGGADAASRFKPGQLYILTAGDDHSCAVFELHG